MSLVVRHNQYSLKRQTGVHRFSLLRLQVYVNQMNPRMISIFLCIVRIVVNICLHVIFLALILYLYHAIENAANRNTGKPFLYSTVSHQPSQPWRVCCVILIVLPISFSMAWYEIVMQRSLVIHQENPACHSYFLASSTRFRAHVYIARNTSDSWDWIFVAYHERELNNLYMLAIRCVYFKICNWNFVDFNMESQINLQTQT